MNVDCIEFRWVLYVSKDQAVTFLIFLTSIHIAKIRQNITIANIGRKQFQ